MTESTVTRRGMIGGIATAAASGDVAAHAQSRPKTFVLIHGAWHGGWCWRRVVDILEQKGHKVFAPTLTGLGERSHLLSKSVNLHTHIADIVNVFKWEDIKDACLCVHSYAGWPGSVALEQIGHRVSSIVWLDAFKPENGEHQLDERSPSAMRDTTLSAVERDNGRPPPKSAVFKVNDRDQSWVDSKLTPQPTGLQVRPVILAGAREKVAKKTYIRASIFPSRSFDRALAECKADKTWRTFETTTAGHDVMVDAPEWLADILQRMS